MSNDWLKRAKERLDELREQHQGAEYQLLREMVEVVMGQDERKKGAAA